MCGCSRSITGECELSGSAIGECVNAVKVPLVRECSEGATGECEFSGSATGECVNVVKVPPVSVNLAEVPLVSV